MLFADFLFHTHQKNAEKLVQYENSYYICGVIKNK
ncbi:TPA_asm: hypothetical protein [Porphyromonas phage phage023a_KCOM2797]|uniref:Uncharacterized protein n=1 Tax=Porphyromonas phage phage023a_KCOM2797 TaxID=3154113 RepID=A0AAT9JEV0_9CAUD